jgi:AcrR family transcriptional regulator
MPRPDMSAERRQTLLPIVTQTFAELGYRRSTTAELARRCGVRENVLYRLWPDKRAMFIAAIEYVSERSINAWEETRQKKADDGGPIRGEEAALAVLDYHARHQGELGLYRIIFAGLSETDDPEVREALATMYRRLQGFIREQLDIVRPAATSDNPAGLSARSAKTQNRERQEGDGSAVDANLAAWGLIGLGTVAQLSLELDLLSKPQRIKLISQVGRALLES